MARAKKKSSDGDKQTGQLGFESILWAAADKLRNNMDAAEYKHVVLGLIFLKYISDAFKARHAKLLEGVIGVGEPLDFCVGQFAVDPIDQHAELVGIE